MSFPVGNSVKVEIGLGAFDGLLLQNWMSREVDSVLFVGKNNQIEYDKYPAGVAEYFATKLALSIDVNKNASIIGVDTSVINPQLAPGSSTKLELYNYEFTKRALEELEIREILNYQGYPFSLTCKTIDKSLEYAISTRTKRVLWGNRDPFDITTQSSGSPITGISTRSPEYSFQGFIGSINVSGTGFDLLDVDGNRLIVDDNLLRTLESDITGSSSTSNEFAIPGSRDQDGQLIEEDVNLNSFVGLGYDRFSVDNTVYVNAIQSLRFLTAPGGEDEFGGPIEGRIDLSGYMQPTLEGLIYKLDFGAILPSQGRFGLTAEGPVPVGQAPARREPYTDFVTANGVVVSSDVNQILTDVVDGLTIEPSRHVLRVRVDDRRAIGLENTPRQILTQRVPQARVNGQSFFIDSINEDRDSSVIITFVSQQTNQ